MGTQRGEPRDARAFRHALGSFATGVTVVTTADASGARFGVTANSFSSVSLEPPLVLWSLSNRSSSLPAFRDCSHFAIHVLRSAQIRTSNQFARPGDKFAGMDVDVGTNGTPLLREFLARFECRSHRAYEGGDHTIFLGEVEHFEFTDDEPLLFVQGEYAAASLHPDRIRDLRAGTSLCAPEDVDYWL